MRNIIAVSLFLICTCGLSFGIGYYSGGFQSGERIRQLDQIAGELSERLGKSEFEIGKLTNNNSELERTLAERIDLDQRTIDFSAEAKRILADIGNEYQGKPDEIRKIAKALVGLKRLFTTQ